MVTQPVESSEVRIDADSTAILTTNTMCSGRHVGNVGLQWGDVTGGFSK